MNLSTRHLPLKDMGEFLLGYEIQVRANQLDFGPQATKAMAIAAICHSGQTRSNRGPLPRDTYITHPLRNALRLLRYGVTDQDLILAAILHDTVEDAAETIVNGIAVYTVVLSEDNTDRALALRFLSWEFGEETARLIEGVTNPVPEFKLSKEGKRAFYVAHVRDALKDPKTAVVKLTDIVDNAVGLYHNTGMSSDAQSHLAAKYMPLIDDFMSCVREEAVIALLTPRGAAEALRHLEKGRTELDKILARV